MPRDAIRGTKRPTDQPASIVTRRLSVRCASCGGAAVATIAVVHDGARSLVEELGARCPRCGDRA